MQVTVDAKVLAESVSAVAEAVAPRTTKPVLAMVKLDLTDGVLSAAATDTEVAVRRVVSAADGEDGAVLIDPKRVLAWLKEQSGNVVVEESDDAVTVRTGRKKLELAKYDANEFPDFTDTTQGTTTVTIPYTRMAWMIGLTAFAADKKEGARWATTCVQMSVHGGKFVMVATDTKRLALTTEPTDADDGAVMVPLKTTSLVVKNGAGDSLDVSLVMAPNAAVFKTDRWTIHTRLVEGKFPPYQQIVPKSLDHTAECQVGQFMSAVREAMVVTDEQAKRVEFHFADGQCRMTARASGVGASESECEVPGFDGDTTVAMDPQYVLDGLKPFGKGEVVKVRLTDANKPVLFHIGGDFTYLVMPLGEKGE
jgi:DNA polymerase-3 subunit beta